MSSGPVKTYNYDTTGRIVNETLPNGSYWTTAYNDTARTVTRAFYASGGGGSSLMSESQSFDRRGNVISRTDVSGNTFTTVYDGLNRVKSTTGPGDASPMGLGTTAHQTTAHVYDAGGLVHKVSNAAGEKTVTYLDALNRPTLISVFNPDGTTASNTGYWYSPDHQSVTTTVGSGSSNPAVTTTTWTDTRGNIVLVKHAVDNTWQGSEYDAQGNQTGHVDEQGAVTTWAYDALNRITSQSLPAGSPGAGAVTTYVYTPVTSGGSTAGETFQRQMPEGPHRPNHLRRDGAQNRRGTRRRRNQHAQLHLHYDAPPACSPRWEIRADSAPP